MDPKLVTELLMPGFFTMGTSSSNALPSQFSQVQTSFTYRPDYKFIEKKKSEELNKLFKRASKENLREALEKNIGKFAEDIGARISLSFYDLKDTMASFNINGDQPGWSASTIKVPVMIEVLRAFDREELSPDELLSIDHQYTLEHFDPVSRMPEGGTVSIRDLVDYMIVVSDNEATNMLANRVGLEKINQAMQELGTDRTMMAHLLAYKAPRIVTEWNHEGSNLTTANDLVKLMALIYKDMAASPQSCEEMRKILEKGSEGLLGRYLPRGTKIGNKIGSISDPECGDDLLDVGVINGDYALAVMCNRIGKRKNHLLKKRLASEKNYREQLLVKEHWDKVKKKLDHLHHSEDLPFYFEVQAHPRFYGQQGRSAADVIGIISKVIHNIYYAGKIMSFGQEICRPR